MRIKAGWDVVPAQVALAHLRLVAALPPGRVRRNNRIGTCALEVDLIDAVHRGEAWSSAFWQEMDDALEQFPRPWTAASETAWIGSGAVPCGPISTGPASVETRSRSHQDGNVHAQERRSPRSPRDRHRECHAQPCRGTNRRSPRTVPLWDAYATLSLRVSKRCMKPRRSE
jgi:hypothetical protein